MNIRKFSVKNFLLAYAIIELLIFVALCYLIGPLLTVLLVVATTIIGVSLLRQNTQEAFRNMQKAQRDPAFAQVAFNNDSGVRSLACIFLILPGFLTDAFGLILFIPFIKNKLLKRMQSGAQNQQQSANVFEGGYKRVADNEEFIPKSTDDDK